MSERTATFAPSWKQFLAWNVLEDKVTEELAYGGAAGGGKSYLGCHWKIFRRMHYKESRGIICRATQESLRESTVVTFNKCLAEWGLKQGVDYWFNATRLTYTFQNGSKEILRDLEYEPQDPDYLRLGSMEVTDAWIEEDFNRIPKKAADILKSRVRWKVAEYGLCPKLLLTFNPGYHWVWNDFVEDMDGNPVALKEYQQFIRARVSDNPDKDFAVGYELQLSRMSPYDRMRLLEGILATEKTGGEFYEDFIEEKHKRDVKRMYDKDHPIHLTFDFNIAPFVTLNIWQVWDKAAKQIDEICRFKNTPATVKEFIKLYSGHNAEILIYGDPAGKHGDTRNEEGQNDFKIIVADLRKAGFRVRELVDAKAPSVSMRGQFINAILKDEYDGISLEIDRSCKKTLEEYNCLQKASDGTKDKKKVEDPITKVRYEKYGHTSDANDYFLCKIFSKEYAKFQVRSTSIPIIVKRPQSSRAM